MSTLRTQLIRSFGLRTPQTLVTTDVDAAIVFWQKHGAVIYKSLSGVRSIVSRLTTRRSLAAGLGLHLAGIDLRRTPEGAWYCFEANPFPGFSFFEDATTQPISRAVAGMLARQSRV